MFDHSLAGEFARLLPPPRRSVARPPWDELLLPGGYAFPRDYQWFMENYGYGGINDYLFVLSLTDWSPRGEAVDAVGRMLSWSRNIDSCGPEHNDPERCDINWQGRLLTFTADDPRGLLFCWGKEDGGNLHYWARETADPERWPVMSFRRPTAEWFRFDGGFLEFLIAVMREEFPCPGQPINPEEEWEHARTRPLWEFEGDWNGPAD